MGKSWMYSLNNVETSAKPCGNSSQVVLRLHFVYPVIIVRYSEVILKYVE